MPDLEQLREAAIAAQQARASQESEESRLANKEVGPNAAAVAEETKREVSSQTQALTQEEDQKTVAERSESKPNIETLPGGQEAGRTTPQIQQDVQEPSATPITEASRIEEVKLPRAEAVEVAKQGVKIETAPVIPQAKEEANAAERKLNPDEIKKATEAAGDAAKLAADAKSAADIKAAADKARVGVGESKEKESPFGGERKATETGDSKAVDRPTTNMSAAGGQGGEGGGSGKNSTTREPQSGGNEAFGKPASGSSRNSEGQPKEDPKPTSIPGRTSFESIKEPVRTQISEQPPRVASTEKTQTATREREPVIREEPRTKGEVATPPQQTKPPEVPSVEKSSPKVPEVVKAGETTEPKKSPGVESNLDKSVSTQPQVQRASGTEDNREARAPRTTSVEPGTSGRETGKEVPVEKGTSTSESRPADRKVEGIVAKESPPIRTEEPRTREVVKEPIRVEEKAPVRNAEERVSREESNRRKEIVQEADKTDRATTLKGDAKVPSTENDQTIPTGRIKDRVEERLKDAPVVKDAVIKDTDEKKAVTVTTSSTGGSGDGESGGTKGKIEVTASQEIRDAIDIKSLSPEELKQAIELVRASLEKGGNVDPKLSEIIQQLGADSKGLEKPALPIELAKNFEDVASPQMTKQEAMQALLGLLVDSERMSNVLVNEIKVDTEVKLSQIQSNIDEVLKLRVEQFIALSASQNGIEGVELQNLLHESLNELATRYGLTEEQRILLGRIMVAVSSSTFEKDDLLIRDKPEDQKELEAAKLRELKLKEALRMREATPEEIEKFRQEELEELKKLLRERDELKRAEAEKKLRELVEEQHHEDEVTYMIDEDLEVIKTYKITGIVLDRITGEPLPDVMIVGGLLGTRITDADGKFEYVNIPEHTVFMIGPDSLTHTFKPPFLAGTVSMGVHLEFRGKLRIQ